MAGKDQHYLPKFLQKGFKSADSGKKRDKTWVYRFDSVPTQSNRIEGIGHSPYFYSGPSDGKKLSLDEEITDVENTRLWRLVDRLRESQAGAADCPQDAAFLFHHMGVRTMAFRDTTLDMMSGALGSASAMFTDERLLAKMIASKNSDIELQSLTKLMTHFEANQEDEAQLNSSGLISRDIAPMIAYALREVSAPELARLTDEFQTAIAPLFGEEGINITKMHEEALTGVIAQGPSIEAFVDVDWRLVDRDVSEPFILPDCAAVTVTPDGDVSPATLNRSKSGDCFVLPLSPDRLLVGLSNGAQMPNFANINLHLASCSHQFFISSAPSAYLAELSKKIGRREQSLVSDIESSIRESIDPITQMCRPKEERYIPPTEVKIGFSYAQETPPEVVKRDTEVLK